jgi:Sulfotransferase family
MERSPIIRPEASVLPMPFVVGSPRSGTTLLRFMLDAHSLLAIPPETGFVPAVAELACSGEAGEASIDKFLEIVTSFPPDAATWIDFELAIEEFRIELRKLSPFTLTEGLRCFYRMYARRFGKPRYGDKTPTYCCWLPLIERLLPEAAFIHVIRDGRDAALSLRQMWFAPGNDMKVLAEFWRDNVLAGRKGGQQVKRYVEVRYERLIHHTAAELRRICEFLQLPYESTMERYFERAPQRLAEHRARVRKDGSVIVTHEQRLWQQRGTTVPPDVGRIGKWRLEMTDNEQRVFREAAGSLLDELGYG